MQCGSKNESKCVVDNKRIQFSRFHNGIVKNSYLIYRTGRFNIVYICITLYGKVCITYINVTFFAIIYNCIFDIEINEKKLLEYLRLN